MSELELLYFCPHGCIPGGTVAQWRGYCLDAPLLKEVILWL
jgi:hypothetical protein